MTHFINLKNHRTAGVPVGGENTLDMDAVFEKARSILARNGIKELQNFSSFKDFAALVSSLLKKNHKKGSESAPLIQITVEDLINCRIQFTVEDLINSRIVTLPKEVDRTREFLAKLKEERK